MEKNLLCLRDYGGLDWNICTSYQSALLPFFHLKYAVFCQGIQKIYILWLVFASIVWLFTVPVVIQHEGQY